MKECVGCNEQVNQLVEGTKTCMKCFKEEFQTYKTSNENNFNLSMEYRKKRIDALKEIEELKQGNEYLNQQNIDWCNAHAEQTEKLINLCNENEKLEKSIRVFKEWTIPELEKEVWKYKR